MKALFSYPVGNQNFTKEAIDYAVARCVAAGLDTLMFQCAVGKAEYYNTTLFPKSSIVTADYDPLQYAIDAAHAAGLELWAWWPMGPAAAWSAWRALNSDAGWNLPSIGGSKNWLNFHNADVQAYCANVVTEICSQYSVDGFCADYVRWPHPSEGFDYTDYPVLSKNDITNTVTAMVAAADVYSVPFAASVWAGWGSPEQCGQYWMTDWGATGVDYYMPMAVCAASTSGRAELAHYITDWDSSGLSGIYPILYFTVGTLKTVSDLEWEVETVRAGGYGKISLAFFHDRDMSSSLVDYVAGLAWDSEPFVSRSASVSPSSSTSPSSSVSPSPEPGAGGLRLGEAGFSLKVRPLRSVRVNITGKRWEEYLPAEISTTIGEHALLGVSHNDTEADDVSQGDLITGQGYDAKWTRLAISDPEATYRNYLGVANGDAEPGYKALFDATTPAALGTGVSGATGSAEVAARRDHTHAVTLNGEIPIRGIIMWSGAVVDIPTNWHLCDGTLVGAVQTPDLRNRFVIGAGGTYAPGDTPGSATLDISHTHGVGTLDAAAEASHTHGVGTLDSQAQADHTHTYGTIAAANDTHNHSLTVTTQAHTRADDAPTITIVTAVGSTSSDDTHNHTMSGSTGSGGAHDHALSGSTAAGSSHDHALSGETASGGSATLANIPASYALCFIMRVA